jgi:transcriptional regulator MraZ
VDEAQPMLLGTHRARLDDKGRLTLPGKWLQEFSLGLILTRGVDQSLLIFPAPKFESIATRIDRLSIESADARRWARFMSAQAADLKPDKKGRLPISPAQLKFAGLVGDVVLVGVLSYVQIWNPQKYEEAESIDLPTINQIAERVDQLLRASAG